MSILKHIHFFIAVPEDRTNAQDKKGIFIILHPYTVIRNVLYVNIQIKSNITLCFTNVVNSYY